MSDQNHDEKLIAGHEYDGIKELDNPLPGWWLFTFFAAIVFAFIYYIHYEFSGGQSLKQEYEVAMQELKATKSAAGPSMSEDTLTEKMKDPKMAMQGKALFAAKCAACHAESGGGLIGPNLTDNFWINGKGTRADIYKVVSAGVPEKGMPAWGEMLKEDEVLAVVSFVYSIKGTQVAGGKPPQGNEVK